MFLRTADNRAHLNQAMRSAPWTSIAFLVAALVPLCSCGLAALAAAALLPALAAGHWGELGAWWLLLRRPPAWGLCAGAGLALGWALAAGRAAAAVRRHVGRGHPFPPTILQYLVDVAPWAGASGRELSTGSCWWEDSNALTDVTDEEEEVLAYLEAAVAELGESPNELGQGPWAMTGKGSAAAMGVEQLSFTSARYHLAFCGYAAAAALMRCPAYPGRLQKLLRRLIEEMLSHRVWGYMAAYWSGEGPESRPFGCEENVMYTGHLLQLVLLLEALTGDGAYRRPGGLRARWADGSCADAADAEALAALCAKAMRSNAVGGMCCEPGLVFFQCQNHVHLSFRLLEGIWAVRDDIAEEEATAEPSTTLPTESFMADTARWEHFALHNLAAPMRSGAFKVVLAANELAAGAQVPFGHPGSDGWCLAWYFPWARSAGMPREIWRELIRPQLYAAYSPFRVPATRAAHGDGGCCHGGKEAEVAEPEPKTQAELPSGRRGTSPGANDCCLTLDIPPGAWLAQLLPAAAEAEDAESFARLRTALRSGWAVSGRGPEGRGRLHLEVGPEWSTGSTANYLLGLAGAASPGLWRRLAHEGPAPGALLRGPHLEAVHPASVAVFRARILHSCAEGRRPETAGAGGAATLALGLRVPPAVASVRLQLRGVREVLSSSRLTATSGSSGWRLLPFEVARGELELVRGVKEEGEERLELLLEVLPSQQAPAPPRRRRPRAPAAAPPAAQASTSAAPAAVEPAARGRQALPRSMARVAMAAAVWLPWAVLILFAVDLAAGLLFRRRRQPQTQRSDYSRQLAALWRMARPQNMTMSALLVLGGAWGACGTAWLASAQRCTQVGLSILLTVLINAGSCMVNDYFDFLARGGSERSPGQRMLAMGDITPREVKRFLKRLYFALLLGICLVETRALRVCVLLSATLMYVYTKTLKPRGFLWRNGCVAAVVALALGLGGVAAQPQRGLASLQQGLVAVLPAMAATFCGILSAELVRDVAGEQADRQAGVCSLAATAGPQAALRLARALLLPLLAAQLLALAPRSQRGLGLMLLTLGSGMLLALAGYAGRGHREARRAAGLMPWPLAVAVAHVLAA